MQEFFTPVLRSLETCPRVVVVGTPPELLEGAERVAQRALEGFTRSLGKEIGKGGTVLMPFEKTFWAEAFGMVTDQFGIKWMVNCDAPK